MTCIDHGLSGNKPAGYHQVRRKGRLQYVHRLSLAEHLNKPVEKLTLVRHLCNNPRCVNPEHLAEGTHQDNANDRVASGRSAKEVPSRRRLSDEDAEIVAIRYATRVSHYCKVDGVVALAKEYNVSTQAIYGAIKRS